MYSLSSVVKNMLSYLVSLDVGKLSTSLLHLGLGNDSEAYEYHRGFYAEFTELSDDDFDVLNECIKDMGCCQDDLVDILDNDLNELMYQLFFDGRVAPSLAEDRLLKLVRLINTQLLIDKVNKFVAPLYNERLGSFTTSLRDEELGFFVVSESTYIGFLGAILVEFCLKDQFLEYIFHDDKLLEYWVEKYFETIFSEK